MNDSNGRNAPDREFLDLLCDLSEEKLTQQSAERLNELLLADAECRRTLIEFMQMTAGLEWEHSGLGDKAAGSSDRAQHSGKAAGSSAIGPPAAIAGRRGSPPLNPSTRAGGAPHPNAELWRQKEPILNWPHAGRVVSISRAAAAILLMGTLCVGILAASIVTVAVMKATAQAERANPPVFVAKLTGVHHVQWADEATAVMVDQLLTEGQTVELLGGWAEISFKSGARIVLEGPAKLQCQAANRARLIQGKVATDEAARKVGFTLDTPTGRVVDLGPCLAWQSSRTAPWSSTCSPGPWVFIP